MKFRVLEHFCLGAPHGDVEPGQTVELTANEGRMYVSQGRLEPVPDVAKGETPAGPPLAVQTQDLKPTRRGGRQKE